MNRIQIHGNITKDIEVAEKGETKYARFTIASDRSTKGESTTDYFRCVAFGDWTSDLADYERGAFVKVNGSVRLGAYAGKPTVEIVAKSVTRPVRDAA